MFRFRFPTPRSRSAWRFPATAALLVAAALLVVPVRPAPAVTVARLSITSGSDGSTALPGPFAVIPPGDRVVVYMPASHGLIVLRGQELLKHLPIPPGFRLEALDASKKLIVGGAPAPEGRITIDLLVFDATTGEVLGRVESANPFLKVPPDSGRGWRVVAGESLAGVFHPPTSASYPLWDAHTGLVASGDQLGRAVTGLGFDIMTRWVPNLDGSVGRHMHGHTTAVLGKGHGAFVGGLSDGTVFMLADEKDAAAKWPEQISLHAYRNGQPVGEIRLRASAGSPPEGSSSTGARVRVVGDRLYWMYLEGDFLEIRSIDPTVTLSKAG